MPGSPPPTRTPSAGPARERLEEPINLGPNPDFDDDLLPENEDSAEIVDSAQPEAEDGVTEDMSTLALNPAHAASETDAASPIALHLNGDFAQMDDAAIMLELKAGNMAGFDFLIAKYRKPIINFMYRMTRNQAVAEELGAGGLPPRLSLPRNLPRGGPLQHLALPDCDQPWRESGTRHQARTLRLNRLSG